MNTLAETMGQVGFTFWDQDVLNHARWLARQTKRRRRVTWDALRGVWVIKPALEQGPRR